MAEGVTQRKAGDDSPPGQIIDLGTHRLHIVCMGQGTPTVVFEAGGGDTSDIWHLVQPQVAKFTCACSYDRASIGWSEPGPRPRTSLQIVQELRSLLTGAGKEGPYVLVAHSYGGMHTQLFARLHPQEVVGMVLVDSIHEDHYDRVPPLIGLEAHDDMVRAASKGEDFEIPDDVLESIKQVRATPPLPDIPILVISAGHDWGPKDSTWGKIRAAWIEMHADLASRAIRGRHIIDRESGHRPHIENPQLVIEAIREVVEEARSQQRREGA
jgi:pimeloyl-ACP methyl ester carboxylesterase